MQQEREKAFSAQQRDRQEERKAETKFVTEFNISVVSQSFGQTLPGWQLLLLPSEDGDSE